MSLHKVKANAPGVGAAVHYEIRVRNPDGSLARRLPRKRNLILDSGLDLCASQLWANLFSYAAVGTGTNPVKRDSGAVTFTRSGNVVTASAGFFESGDAGRLIKWDSGEEAYITQYNSTVEVETADSGSIAAAEGTVWYVNRTGLQAEVKRTNIYGPDTGDNGSTFALGQWVLKRTFIFSAESGAVTYNEIGWSPASGAGANLFGMDIISGGVSLIAGQQLEVIVELSLSIGPAEPVAWSAVIAGWSQDGDACAECVTMDRHVAIAGVTTFGASDATNGVGGNNNPVFEPSVAKGLTLSTMSTALESQTDSSLPITGAIATKSLTPQTYINGTFSRNFVGTFSISEGNSAAIRSLIVNASFDIRVFRVLLDAAETKDSDHTLSITFTLSWNRVLVN